MKLLHTVSLSVFVKENEDKEKVKKAFLSFIPFDLEKEHVFLSSEIVEGLNENKIVILKIDLQKEKYTAAFVQRLQKVLSKEQKELLVSQNKSRLDDAFFFFIRLDKNALVERGVYEITEKGNCFHIQMNIACFPRTRESAYEIIKKIFL